jgi:probable phosphoglycerate mutase
MQDLPLTKEGLAQARRAGAFCRQETYQPQAIYCAPLLRTRQTAEEVASAGRLPVLNYDPRLTEIDFGDWGGLTMDEVRRRFGNAEATAWDRDRIMPDNRGWSPSAAEITAGLEAFASEAVASGMQCILAVTSNGILRFAASLVPGLFEQLHAENKLKVSTGNLCCLEWRGDAFACAFWNRKPD